ncbi:ribonuclease H, partial [Trifolium medium]|nr:ribonuclease H [Trifolium medium]
GYTQKIVTCDMFHAEMWGMYEGVKLARRRGVTHLLVESDSTLLTNMVTERCNLSGAIPHYDSLNTGSYQHGFADSVSAHVA